jgi:hypothetical protein
LANNALAASGGGKGTAEIVSGITLQITASSPFSVTATTLTALEAANLAEHIYSAVWSGQREHVYGAWHLNYVHTNDQGLRIGVYVKLDESGNPTEYALVNKGTTPSNWLGWEGVNNLAQPVGWSQDMRDSRNYALMFKLSHRDYGITMVGHSKGGAEAIVNAVASNSNAITFNTMSPSIEEYVSKFSIANYRGNMTHYIVQSDILNNLFGEPSMGTPRYLRAQFFNERQLHRDGETYRFSTPDSLANHGMVAVLRAFSNSNR